MRLLLITALVLFANVAFGQKIYCRGIEHKGEVSPKAATVIHIARDSIGYWMPEVGFRYEKRVEHWADLVNDYYLTAEGTIIIVTNNDVYATNPKRRTEVIFHKKGELKGAR